MKKAFENVSGHLFTPDEDIIEKGIQASRESERKRIILPLHRRQDAKVQRMLNFLQPETYVRPHMHPRNQAIESIVVHQGAIRFLVFDDEGKITQDHILDSEHIFMADIEPLTWHSFVVLEKDTILFESKMGPYDADLDKIFAEWSPEEFTDDAQSWIEHLS